VSIAKTSVRPLPLLIISSSEQSLRTTSIPFGPEAKTKQAISSY
jgi:hypothetical protein